MHQFIVYFLIPQDQRPILKTLSTFTNSTTFSILQNTFILGTRQGGAHYVNTFAISIGTRALPTRLRIVHLSVGQRVIFAECTVGNTVAACLTT